MKKFLLFSALVFVCSFSFSQEASVSAWDAAVKAIDQDGDGKCSAQECNDFIEKSESQMAILRQQIQLARFLRLDQNQDGVISKDELPEDNPQMSNQFDRFDVDKNGKLDQEELKKMLETVGGNWQGARQGRGNREQNVNRPGAQRQQQQQQQQQRGERRQRGQRQQAAE